jgi:hypothetical protein
VSPFFVDSPPLYNWQILRPPLPLDEGLWKGVLDNGKTGYFDSSLTAPFIEVKASLASPTHKKTKASAKVSRKGQSSVD